MIASWLVARTPFAMHPERSEDVNATRPRITSVSVDFAVKTTPAVALDLRRDTVSAVDGQRVDAEACRQKKSTLQKEARRLLPRRVVSGHAKLCSQKRNPHCRQTNAPLRRRQRTGRPYPRQPCRGCSISGDFDAKSGLGIHCSLKRRTSRSLYGAPYR